MLQLAVSSKSRVKQGQTHIGVTSVRSPQIIVSRQKGKDSRRINVFSTTVEADEDAAIEGGRCNGNQVLCVDIQSQWRSNDKGLGLSVRKRYDSS